MRWNPFTRRRYDRDEPPAQITTFGGIAQVRPNVGVFPQAPGDPVQQGVETPSRPARWPIVILTGINPDAVAEGRFTAAIISPHPHASYSTARMTPDQARSNIPVPPHVAYGSLFVAGPAQGFY